jgi:hypothetical protein
MNELQGPVLLSERPGIDPVDQYADSIEPVLPFLYRKNGES